MTAVQEIDTWQLFPALPPVLCAYPYGDAHDAIGRAHALRPAFQAAVITRDIDYALGVASRLAAPAVMVNDHTAFRADWMPFAELKA